MWSWMADNAQVLNIWIGIGTLLVWLFYAHLLYSGFRRVRQSQILITQGGGTSIDSLCLITNMSQESVYLKDIILSLYVDDGVHRVSVTDFENRDLEAAASAENPITRQGPLSSDQYINVGTFRFLARQAARAAGLKDLDDPGEMLGINALKITVVAIYGPSGSIIAAQRKFNIIGDDNEHLEAEYVSTRQMRGMLARRRVRRWVGQPL
jgi:hypothetical protein